VGCADGTNNRSRSCNGGCSRCNSSFYDWTAFKQTPSAGRDLQIALGRRAEELYWGRPDRNS